MKKEYTGEEIQSHLERVEKIFTHIRNVQDNSFTLGKRLIKKGEVELGKRLIARSLQHDASKFSGIEYSFLGQDKDKKMLALAIENHQAGNNHHPEHYPEGIAGMSRTDLGEMVCDWLARSREMGKDLRAWVKDVATKRFDFTLNQKVGREITEFINLLIDDKL